ncbi:KH domain-containing protein [soil metagenome]
MSYAPFVEKLITSVVDEPDKVVIEEDEEMGARTFYIRCAPDDVGKVIGKSGRVVSAIRLVVSAVAAKSREKAFVRIVTED